MALFFLRKQYITTFYSRNVSLFDDEYRKMKHMFESVVSESMDISELMQKSEIRAE
jgi:hypothetical protein